MIRHFHLACCAPIAAGASPYRLHDSNDQEVPLMNDFLDAQCIRGLSLRTLRAYGFDLLNFARWWFQSSRRDLRRLNHSGLLDYVRYQLQAKPTPQTINHRLVVLECLYRFHCGQNIPGSRARLGHAYSSWDPFGYGKRGHVVAALRLKQPRRVVVPLSVEEVSRFWRSFRTYRDISIIALMLFDGLRSREVMELHLEDLCLSQAQLRVHGKGNRDRIMPLADAIVDVVQPYIQLERPLTSTPYLFVSLKGSHRGRPMTPAGFRSLFRHHRIRTRVSHANPHRFRHTFGSDMVRAGVSLPALMHLMGHSNIKTTMLYVQLSPEDVWREYFLAVQKKTRVPLPEKP
jgi:site-specific recombinase XerD